MSKTTTKSSAPIHSATHTEGAAAGSTPATNFHSQITEIPHEEPKALGGIEAEPPSGSPHAVIVPAETTAVFHDDPLTDEDRQDLDSMTLLVVHAVVQFFLAGKTLKEIRQRRLFREKYQTFENYCKAVLDISEARASQIIGAADEYETLKELGIDASLIPENERALRAIKKVDTSSKARVLALASTIAAGAHLTSANIEKAWRQLSGAVDDEPSVPGKVSPDSALKAAKTLKEFMVSDRLGDIKRKDWDEMKELLDSISKKAAVIK